MVPPFVEMIGQCLSEGSMQIVPKVSVFDLRARVARLLASARVKISWRVKLNVSGGEGSTKRNYNEETE